MSPDIADFLLEDSICIVILSYLKNAIVTWKDSATNLNGGCKTCCKNNTSEITLILCLKSPS